MFANQRQLPSDLVNRVLEYYDFQHSKTKTNAGSLSVKLSRTLEVKVAKKKFGPYIDRCCGKGQVLGRTPGLGVLVPGRYLAEPLVWASRYPGPGQDSNGSRDVGRGRGRGRKKRRGGAG